LSIQEGDRNNSSKKVGHRELDHLANSYDFSVILPEINRQLAEEKN